jgi:VanZ family protein
MIVIYSGSTEVMSARRTSRFIVPFLRWIKPDISDYAIGRVQYSIRKVGHLSEYALLGILLWRACRQPIRNDPRGWNWRHAAAAWILAAVYSATDEVHQAFVPSREAHFTDVLIDMAGASIGLLLVWWWGRWRGRWS